MTFDKGIILSEVLETYLTVFILLVPDLDRIKSPVMWYHGIFNMYFFWRQHFQRENLPEWYFLFVFNRNTVPQLLSLNTCILKKYFAICNFSRILPVIKLSRYFLLLLLQT